MCVSDEDKINSNELCCVFYRFKDDLIVGKCSLSELENYIKSDEAPNIHKVYCKIQNLASYYYLIDEQDKEYWEYNYE